MNDDVTWRVRKLGDVERYPGGSTLLEPDESALRRGGVSFQPLNKALRPDAIWQLIAELP